MKNDVIETVEIGKYQFQITTRENECYLPSHKFRVVYSRLTPKARFQKSKVIKSYAFDSVVSCEKYIEEVYRKIYLNMKSDAERKEQKRQANAQISAKDFYQIGDIVRNSWGYEQTNIEFYQVVKMTAKTIFVKEIAGEMVEGSMYDHGMAWKVTALKDEFIETGREYKLRVYADGRLSSPESYYHFTKWNGTPEYKSTYY